MLLRATVIERLALVGLMSLVAPSLAHAHKSDVRRTLFLEPYGDRELHIIVAIKIPGGVRRRALDVWIDRNHDGRLVEEERKALTDLLTSRALDGLSISTGTSALALEGLEVKARIAEGDGPVEVMIHATSRCSLRPGTTVVVSTGEAGDPLDLVVIPGARRVETATRGEPRQGGLKTQLGLRDRVSLSLE